MKAWYLAFAACLIGAKAWGHHSFAAVYLEEQEVTIEGRLVQFLWRNPHTLVHVMVEQDDGTNVRYVVEWGSATQLGASGVTQATLRPGDYVVVNGNPGRNPEDNRVRLLNFLSEPRRRNHVANQPDDHKKGHAMDALGPVWMAFEGRIGTNGQWIHG